MKNTVAKIALSSLLVSGILVAGKNVAPVEAPVVPVVGINPLYVGLGLLWSGTSVDCPCANDVRKKETTYGVIGRIGYDFNQYIGIEARAFKASLDKDFAETTHYGIYLKPQYHITDKLNVYGLVGYGKTEIDFSCTTMDDYDDAGLSMGIGFEYDMSDDSAVATSRNFDGQGDQEKGWGIWVDYQNLLHNEGAKDIKANIVTAGVTYDF
jgi:OOP family OmpA-OmpF porin